MVDTPNHQKIIRATRAWLRDVLTQSGLTPYALARRAGLAQTTVTRFLNQDVKYTLKASTISKIMNASGVAAPPSILLGVPSAGEWSDSVDLELLIRAIIAAFSFAGLDLDEEVGRNTAQVAAELYVVLLEKGGDEAAINEAIDTLRLSYRHRNRPPRQRR
jgi:transcriptional regulator with XRE-family HTH domain